MSQLENHIATAQDFTAAQQIDRQVQRVSLPKLGKVVLMRRPAPLWFVFRGQLPISLSAAAAGEQAKPCLKTAEDAQKFMRWILDLLSEVMVCPKVVQDPGPEEIAPEMIADEDLNFIIKWAVGEVAPDGRGLADFRCE